MEHQTHQSGEGGPVFNPFSVLVAQVTDPSQLAGIGAGADSLKRTVHTPMSQDDDLPAETPKAPPRALRQINRLQANSGLQPPLSTGDNGMSITRPNPHDPSSRPSRQITPAEKSLIQKMHGLIPAQQLLNLLNERLRFDLGPTATPYTMDQLKAEIDTHAVTLEDGPKDWAGMRKLINKARKSGVLEQITEQVINDFAIVYSLNAKQVLNLKDVLLDQTGE